jgi:N-methylhydantoinase B/oxoprolinase/acetone carboxylase alpha subunit
VRVPKAAFSVLAITALAANAQSVFVADEVNCSDFSSLLAEAEAGSVEALPLQATAYRDALIDSFASYYGRSSVEREWERILERCETTVRDAVERLSDDIFYEFEAELRMQIEYESE